MTHRKHFHDMDKIRRRTMQIQEFKKPKTPAIQVRFQVFQI